MDVRPTPNLKLPHADQNRIFSDNQVAQMHLKIHWICLLFHFDYSKAKFRINPNFLNDISFYDFDSNSYMYVGVKYLDFLEICSVILILYSFENCFKIS